MITTVNDVLQSSKRINIAHEAEQSFFEISPDVTRLQKEQLMDGGRNDDEYIFNVVTGSNQYSESYAKIKGKSGPIDLRAEGNFYNGIHTAQESEGLKIDSDDSKSEMLKEIYGEEIFGMDTKSRNELAPIAGERLRRNVELQINER